MLHTKSDGKGYREVFVDGVLVNTALEADTEKGYVLAAVYPLEIDENDELKSYRIEGKVEVKFL